MYIRRAVLFASPQEDTAPSSNLALLPLLSLSVVGLILLFFIVRFVRRGLHFPNLAWFRGKGQGSRGRLSPSGVELLPTSFKSVPATSPSPFTAAFNLEGNAGKSGISTLLSRSSSLDALPQLSVSSPPKLTSRKHPDWRAPFSLPAFFNSKSKPPHRRSKSLNSTPRNTSLSMPISAPPSPKNFLIDISTSGSSPTSTSSDLGIHKLHPASPLIPGLPIPSPSPEMTKTISGTQTWTFDVEDESHDIADSQVRDPLFTALKRTQFEALAKPRADPMPLIQYDQPSSPPSPVPPLVPKRLNNPFAGLVDSFSSQTFISDRPTASSSSLPLVPSSPPGIELVSLKPTTIQTSSILLDLSNNDVAASYRKKPTSPTGSTQRVAFVDPLVTAVDGVAPTHDIHMETSIDPAESVSGPFEGAHARTLATGLNGAWNSNAVPSLSEESHQPPAELTLPLQSAELSPAPAVPVPVPPSLLPSHEPTTVEKSSLAEPEAPTSIWQWNGGWSPPAIPVSQPVNERPSSSTAPLRGAKDEESIFVEREAGNDLMSFDHEESVPIDEVVVKDRLEPVGELGFDVSHEMDPADTWFTEEPTAVWDADWTGQNVKEDILLDEKGVDDDDTDVHLPLVSQEEHINVLDELLASSSEPIKVHVFEERVEDTISEQSFPQDLNASTTTTPSNDNNDVHEPSKPHSNIPTPIILTTTPFPSTHATPNTPLPELPSLVVVASSPTVEECPDPDIMPLPDFPPLSVAPTPVSPVPVKPQPLSIHQAQTPTPPASPPPWSNATVRPLSSLKTAGAPAFGQSATTVIPPVPEANTVTKPVVEIENKADESDCVLVMMKEDTMVEKVIEPPADELSQSFEEKSTMAERLPGPELIPGTFPTSPSKAPAALPGNVAPSPPASPTTKVIQAHATIPVSNRIRTPRSVIDIALAMQLRPGLGAGADPAWMVRFLMAMFGWFAILASGDLHA